LSHNLYAVTRSHETPGDTANVDLQSADVGQESRCNQSDPHGMLTIL
jgi:hypothetical protein